MTLLERLEEMLHPHHDDAHADRRHAREHEKQDDHHHVDLSTGSEYLDIM